MIKCRNIVLVLTLVLSAAQADNCRFPAQENYQELHQTYEKMISAGRFPPYSVCSTNASSHDAAIDRLFGDISEVRRAAAVIQEVLIQMLQFLDEYCPELRCEEQEWRKMKEMLQSLIDFLSPCERKNQRKSQRIIASYFTEMRSLLRNQSDDVCPLIMTDVMMRRLLHRMSRLSARV